MSTLRETILQDTETRRKLCPVRGKTVTEYLLPIANIRRSLKKSQIRSQDSASTMVAELRDSILEVGLELGICVEWSEKEGCFLIAWGNTRFRAVSQFENMPTNPSAPGMKNSHIWASLYEEPAEEKLTYQAKENNLHKPASKAKDEDNAVVICRMIQAGQLDQGESKYANLSFESKKERIREKAKECLMPMNRFTSIWNKVKVSDPSTERTFGTWDKEGNLLEYFNNHNPWDASVTGSGDVFTFKGKRISVYFATRSTEFSGAALFNAAWKRNTKRECDMVLFVVCFNDSNEEKVSKLRDDINTKIREWADTLNDKHCVSEVWYVPQTEREQENFMHKGEFVSKKVYEPLPVPVRGVTTIAA